LKMAQSLGMALFSKAKNSVDDGWREQ